MRLQELDHGLDLARNTPGHVRGAGLHASDLYTAFYQTVDPERYDKRGANGERRPFDLVKMELGMAFEHVLEPALRERLFMAERPGEFCAGHAPECATPDSTEIVCGDCGAGTLYSPDFLFDSNGTLTLGEFKLTWYSSTGAPTDPKFSKWWSQIRLYCYWLQVTRARLYVFFVNGDYKPPTPSLRCWEAVFSRQELRDEARALLKHAKRKGLLVTEAI